MILKKTHPYIKKKTDYLRKGPDTSFEKKNLIALNLRMVCLIFVQEVLENLGGRKKTPFLVLFR